MTALEKYTDPKRQKRNFYITLFLLCMGIFYDIKNLITGDIEPVRLVIFLINYVIILAYYFVDYDRPHGNTLRYIMLVFAFNVLIVAMRSYAILPYYSLILMVPIILIPFVAGRLERIEKNDKLNGKIMICFLISEITASVFAKRGVDTTGLYKNIAFVLQWNAIANAYFFRYKMHKDAGMENKD